MKLYCVRHGEAQSDQEDPQRMLTERGVDEISKVAKLLNDSGVHVAHILHSTKCRTKQTAEIFAEIMGANQIVECKTILDGDSPIADLVTMINSWAEDTMIVGHLPYLAQLVSKLVIDDENFFPIVNFPPGAIVCLDHYEQNRWIINWLLRPSIIPDDR